uniref:Uncharacterized protein n=1 Tax=Romanomermis culicivorax TaxID=13658 RepID=A0A915IE56_ROMCU
MGEKERKYSAKRAQIKLTFLTIFLSSVPVPGPTRFKHADHTIEHNIEAIFQLEKQKKTAENSKKRKLQKKSKLEN